MTLSDDLRKAIELTAREIAKPYRRYEKVDSPLYFKALQAIEARLGPLLDFGSRYLVPEKWDEYKAALQRAKEGMR